MAIRVDLSENAASKNQTNGIKGTEKQSPDAEPSSSSEVPSSPKPPSSQPLPPAPDEKEEISKPLEENVEVSRPEAMEVEETPAPKTETILTTSDNTTTVDIPVVSSTVTISSSGDTSVITAVASSNSVMPCGNGVDPGVPCSSAVVTSDPGVINLLSLPTSEPSTPDVSNSCPPLSAIPTSGNNLNKVLVFRMILWWHIFMLTCELIFVVFQQNCVAY